METKRYQVYDITKVHRTIDGEYTPAELKEEDLVIATNEDTTDKIICGQLEAEGILGTSDMRSLGIKEDLDGNLIVYRGATNPLILLKEITED